MLAAQNDGWVGDRPGRPTAAAASEVPIVGRARYGPIETAARPQPHQRLLALASRVRDRESISLLS